MDRAQAAHLAFVLFLPDAMRLNRWPRLGGLIDRLGATPVGAVPVGLDTARHAAIYESALVRETGRERLPTRWLLPSLFTLDMGILLLLHRADGGLLADLGALKGSARRQGRPPDTLRATAPLAERGLSLVHIADSVEEMARQLPILLDGVSIEQLRPETRPGLTGAARAADLRGYVEIGAEARRFGLPRRLIRRALTTLCWDPRLRPDPSIGAALDAAAEDGLDDDDDLQLAGLQAALAAVAPPAMALRCDPSLERRLLSRAADLIDMATMLARPDRLAMADGPRLAATFRAHHLYLDPWEQHCLSVFCAFPPS